jgi:hypothetical protein
MGHLAERKPVQDANAQGTDRANGRDLPGNHRAAATLPTQTTEVGGRIAAASHDAAPAIRSTPTLLARRGPREPLQARNDAPE